MIFQTRLFADDCILYRQIYNHDDSITLQQDLDNLAAGEKMWGMQFHSEKCISLSQDHKYHFTPATASKVIPLNQLQLQNIWA
jgi:hypothetical protein